MTPGEKARKARVKWLEGRLEIWRVHVDTLIAQRNDIDAKLRTAKAEITKLQIARGSYGYEHCHD